MSMKTIIGTGEMTPITPYPVVAIGNFDGIHLGHRSILMQTVARAKRKHGTPVVLTFRPHPSHVLSPKQPALLLTHFEEKIRLLESYGIHTVLCVEFSKEFAHQTPAHFAQHLLAEKIGCKEVIVGEGFVFGKNRSGNTADLAQFGQQFGFEVLVHEPILFERAAISSSRIRALLQEGAVSKAAKMLSRPYTLDGKVVHGDGEGKKLGFPTANVQSLQQLMPKEGVYVTRATFSGHAASVDSITYIGSKPTFQKKAAIQIEVHLLDFHENLYEKQLEISFLDCIRGDKRFPNRVSLIKQIQQDIKKTQLILKGIPKTS
jgi:riboflavin kinase/FMN adenylyltransferase